MSNFLFSSFIFFCSDVSGSSDEETRIALWARWQIKHQEFMAWIPWLLQDFVWWGSWAGWPHQHAGDELLVGSLRIVVTPLSVVCAHHGTLTVLQRPHTQRSAHIWYASCDSKVLTWEVLYAWWRSCGWEFEEGPWREVCDLRNVPPPTQGIFATSSRPS